MYAKFAGAQISPYFVIHNIEIFLRMVPTGSFGILTYNAEKGMGFLMFREASKLRRLPTGVQFDG
jgi:hypothetical protein